MRIQQYLRGHQSLSPPEPYVVPESTAYPAPAMVELPCVSAPSMREEKVAPNILKIRCAVEAVPLQPASIQMQCYTNGTGAAARGFYDSQAALEPEIASHSRYQAIELRYLGSGVGEDDNKEEAFTGQDTPWGKLQLSHPNQVVYKHSFVTQQLQSQPLIQHRYRREINQWFVIPPLKREALGVNHIPFLGYGGYMPPAGGIEQIEQVYARMVTQHNVTCVELRRHGYFTAQQIVPPRQGNLPGAKIIFVDTAIDHPSCLEDAIKQGQIKLGFAQDNWSHMYISCGYEQAEADHTINLIFKSTPLV